MLKRDWLSQWSLYKLMAGQTIMTLEHRTTMAKIDKGDCVTIEQALKEVNVSKATLYTYMNYLDVQRHKFPFDRKSYILKSDLLRIKEFMEGNR